MNVSPRILFLCTCAAGTSACVLPPNNEPLVAEGQHYDMTFVYGDSMFDEDFEPLDEGQVGGFVFGFGRREEGLRYELGISAGGDDSGILQPFTNLTTTSSGFESVSFENSFLEFYAGARYEFRPPTARIRPYIAGGLSMAEVRVDSSPPPDGPDGTGDVIDHADPVQEEDTSIGGYLRGGVRYGLGDTFSVGLDYRMRLGGEFDLDLVELAGGSDLNGSAGFVSLTLGWSF